MVSNATGIEGVSPGVLGIFYSDIMQSFDTQQAGVVMDMNEQHLRRSLRECTEATHYYNITPKELLVHARDNSGGCAWVLRVNITPTAQTHRSALDVTRVATQAAADQLNSDPKRITGKMLCVSVVGIQNDHVHTGNPLSHNKRFSLQQVGWTPHNKFGVHDLHYIRFALPKVKEYARWIGEIHLMTQVAKAILKTREGDILSSPEVAEAVAEQRGAQLKDEGKLCSYWHRVHSLLDCNEEACLQKFVSQLKSRADILKIEYKSGGLAQACEPVGVHADRPKIRSLNRLHTTLTIKGACSVPIESLNRSDKLLKIRINNDWDIEIGSMAYD